MTELPMTPDFDIWPVTHRIADASIADGHVCVRWSDGRQSRYHAFFLRENSSDEDTLHPLSRETVLSPLALPEDLAPRDVNVDEPGALEVTWSHGGHVSRYHPGWLRAHGWFGTGETATTQVLWTGDEQPLPPSFDGPAALNTPENLLAWLEALRDYGVARLENLPQRDGLLEDVVCRIGTVRESNFGRSYTLEIKDDPDSNAFTSEPLLQHADMPTRESPHGLQFLYCRENSTTGGEGIYTDGYRIAKDMSTEEPEHFKALTEVAWEYNNRSRTSSYRASGPVIECDASQQIAGIRYVPWLRAPLMAPIEEQDRAYRSFRAFARRAQDERYQMVFSYRPGDLLAFDNRRVLHGRKGYDAKGGTRFIEGIYSDRDDLHSCIRTLKRQLAGASSAQAAE